ncbi:DciA family protein [Orbaceae bacterium ESL0721]|nr:DciA family protein [Orbaceae bacterium ESL0721]
MRSNRPQILVSILDHADGLSQIHKQTIALAKLTRMVKTLLPSPLNEHCRVANYRQGLLILEVSSASWLSRLKYEQSDLILGIRQKLLPALSSIQYKINPDLTHKPVVNKQPTESLSSKMTLQSAFYLHMLAEHAPEKLKKQLIKLANHAK